MSARLRARRFLALALAAFAALAAVAALAALAALAAVAAFAALAAVAAFAPLGPSGAVAALLVVAAALLAEPARPARADSAFAKAWPQDFCPCFREVSPAFWAERVLLRPSPRLRANLSRRTPRGPPRPPWRLACRRDLRLPFYYSPRKTHSTIKQNCKRRRSAPRACPSSP